MSRQAVICILGFTSVSAAYGGVADAKLTFLGLGAVPCTEFLASPSMTAHKSPFVQWASGFVSGLEDHKYSAAIRKMTITDVAVALTNRCSNNPSETIKAATLAAVIEFGKTGRGGPGEH